MLLEIEKELFANATFAASTYQISRTIIRQLSHPVDADRPTAILRVGDREHRYHASLERSVRRSSINDTFAESFSTPNSPIWICTRMRTKSPYFSPGTHPSNQAEMGARSPDLSAIPSFLFLLRYLPPSSCLSSLSLIMPAYMHCSLSRARPISRPDHL